MSTDVYQYLGGLLTDLTKSKMILSAANKTIINVVGLSPPIQFHIGESDFEMQFNVVSDLSGAVILGRDYLSAYDVLVDMMNRRLIIRNPDQRYTIEEHLLDTRSNIHVGSMVGKIQIDTQGMSIAEFRVKPRRNRNKTTDNAPWLAYVQPRHSYKMEEQGMRIAKTIAMVRNDTVYAPILNIGGIDQGNPKNAQITVTAAKIEYTRHTRELETDSDEEDSKRRRLDAESMTEQDATPIPKPLEERIEGTMATKFKEEGSCKAIELREKLHDDNSILTGLSISSDEETLETRTEFPLEDLTPLPDTTKKKEFQKRPNLDSLKDQLTKDQFQAVSKVIDDYDSLFSKSPSDVGCTHLLEHEIELEEGAIPFKEPLRRVGADRQKIADDQIKLLSTMGMIRPSKSPFASAVVLVKKTDGTMRFCVDFRRLNDITVKDAFPLPMISEHLGKLGAAKFFTSLDMGSAFWQVPLTKESIPRTAFTTADNLWEWTRMPFGLCNATATFQRLMTRAIGDITSKYGNLVLCYVDDILIATNTVEQHVERLKEVFECLQKAGLKLKAAKCKIMETSVKFLGRTVSEKGIMPDAGQVQKILDWQSPDTKSQLESFIGLANYYREFIKDFAKIIAPLNKLKSKNVEFVWTDETEEAFQNVKIALTTEPVLALPNEEGLFILDTDASAVAIAGILQQKQMVRGVEKTVVINYGSRGLRGSERNYGAAKLEMLAALIFIEHNRKFLYGKRFIIRCDNMAFSWLKSYSTKSEHVNRWIARLDGFDFKIEHRDRNKHTNADGLSKKTEYYRRRENHVCPLHMGGFKFLSQEQFDELPLLSKEQADEKIPSENAPEPDEVKGRVVSAPSATFRDGDGSEIAACQPDENDTEVEVPGKEFKVAEGAQQRDPPDRQTSVRFFKTPRRST